MGLNVEAWRLLSEYASLFSKKDGRGGLTSPPPPPPPPPPGAVLLLFVLVLFQNNGHCFGERGAAEIRSYNKITKIFKKHELILQSVSWCQIS